MGNNTSTSDNTNTTITQSSTTIKKHIPPPRYIYDYVPDFPCPLDPHLTHAHESSNIITDISGNTSRIRIIRETAAEPIQPQKLPRECFNSPTYSSLTWCISIALNYCLQNIRPRILISESQIWNYCYTRKYGGGTLISATHFLTFRECLQILSKTPGIFNIKKTNGEMTIINFEYYRISPSQILEQLREYRLILIGLPIFSNFWKILQGRQKIKIVVSPSKYDRYLGGMWGIIMGYTAITESFKVLVPVSVDGGVSELSGSGSSRSRKSGVGGSGDVELGGEQQSYAIIDVSEEFITTMIRDMWLLDIWLDSHNMETLGEIAQLKDGEKSIRKIEEYNDEFEEEKRQQTRRKLEKSVATAQRII